eukprot:2241679-Rhodomonas_salina.2
MDRGEGAKERKKIREKEGLGSVHEGTLERFWGAEQEEGGREKRGRWKELGRGMAEAWRDKGNGCRLR